MRLPEESPPRIQHMHNLPRPSVSRGNNIRTKNPRMPARQAVRPFTADLYRCNVQLPMVAFNLNLPLQGGASALQAGFPPGSGVK